MPHPVVPEPRPSPGPPFGAYNRLSHVVVERVYTALWKGEIDRWRRKRLGLRPLPRGFSHFRYPGGELPFVFGYSEAVVPRPPDWSQRLRVAGTWFLDRQGGGEPPAALAEFLAAAPAPVYVGFGSLALSDASPTISLVREGLRRAGVRAVVSIGPGSQPTVRLSDRELAIGEVPHDWLFPRVAAVVHHGGAGTTATGLRAGVPSVVVPAVGDEFFWGSRVRSLRAGPPPVPLTGLTVDRLAAAVHAAVADERTRHTAADRGRRIRSEDGVARGVEALESLLGSAGCQSSTGVRGWK